METSFERVPIEQVQEYWNRRPCNIRHSPRPVGTREYFDEVDARRYMVEPHILRFADFERWRGKRVLEIGCGIGTDTSRFARAGAQVTAVDLSTRSIEIARQRMEVYGVADRVQFYPGSAEDLARIVPIETFDLIYSFGVIHHTPHPERVLEQIRQYVGPQTTLKIMVYNRHSWKVAWILATYGRGKFWKLDQMVAEHSEAQTGCPVTFTYTPNQARTLLAGHGLRVSEMWVDHVFPYRIPDYTQYRYVRNWYFRWMPDRLFRAFEQRFGWHLCVTAVPA
jgi:2-polyprenyl-3-methyl-5-hydroxy-6-metoxy-1,4-benzoquinol methylase